MDIIKHTEQWFKEAIPSPTEEDFSVQLSVFLEEFSETLSELYLSTNSQLDQAHLNNTTQLLFDSLHSLIDLLRNRGVKATVANNILFLDGLADTVVTAVGTAYAAKMNLPGALQEVNRSNHSKFVNGKPIFFEGTRKIAKGPDYQKPDLEPFVDSK